MPLPDDEDEKESYSTQTNCHICSKEIDDVDNEEY